MPELPDLQVFSRNLTRLLKGKTLQEISLPVTRKTTATAKELNEALGGKKLKEVARIGKQLCMDFGKGSKLFMHLMLHGKLVLQEPAAEEPGHVIAALNFKDQVLYLADYQKSAHLILNPPESESVDALSRKLTARWLAGQLGGSRAKIKAVLMDQKVIAGIGNAYADEILWEARIAPQSVAGRIPAAAVQKLARSIGKVLGHAEKQILKQQPGLISGEIRDFLKIHNPRKKSSPTGGKIVTASVGGRTTYYTNEQIVYQ